MRNKFLSMALLGLSLLAPLLAKADDETAALAKFNRTVQSADPRAVQAAFEQTHTNPPTKAEIDQIMKTMIASAIDVMDQADQFEKNFPQSQQLAHVRDSLNITLTRDFGTMGFPMPANRARDVETCARNLLKQYPKDASLYMLLVRVAQALPRAEGLALARELGGDSTPEPARSMARQSITSIERVGQPLDINFTALDGRQINLVDYRGKVVLIDFWATTCVPCVRELPAMKQLYEKTHTNGLEIIGISLDTDKAALTRFLEREKLPWPQYFDAAGQNSPLATKYGISAIPIVWLVDKKGNLRHLDARTDQEQKVEALLKE